MPSPLSSPSRVNKPSSGARRMAVGLPNRGAESSFYLRSALFISCGGRGLAGESSQAFEAAGRASAHLFPRPKRGLRAEECAALCRSSKRKIISKRGLSAEPALFLYQTCLSTAARDGPAFNMHFMSSFRPVRCKCSREQNLSDAR